MSESEFVTKVKALPLRERMIWFELTIADTPIYEVATMTGLTTQRIEEILNEIQVRLGIAE